MNHIERLIIERRELNERIERLESFMDSVEFENGLSDLEKDRLTRQRVAMRTYLNILDERLSAHGLV